MKTSFKRLTLNQKSHICNDNEGSFTCACNTGYDLSSGRYCNDQNECSQSNDCPQHSTCSNTDGSYECACHEGYKYIDDSSPPYCANINECTEGTHNCEQRCTG